MSIHPKKVLLAIDGSLESMKVVNYACTMLDPKHSEITLFHVMSTIPEVFLDTRKHPEILNKVEEVQLFQEKQKASISQFMNVCFERFDQAGFPAEHVASRICRQQRGIARDIVSEAQRGYDVLIVGRGKTGSGKDGYLGGVASKILNAELSPAVWLVGDVPASTTLLVALDSSENSLKALKHAGQMARYTANAITLFHAVRNLSVPIEGFEEIFPSIYRENLQKDAEQEIQSVMKLGQAKLVKIGISPERISTRIVTGVESRAAAILAEARAGRHGTIVVGRRGVSEVLDFSMGRVTNKLTQLAKQNSLWIVG